MKDPTARGGLSAPILGQTDGRLTLHKLPSSYHATPSPRTVRPSNARRIRGRTARHAGDAGGGAGAGGGGCAVAQCGGGGCGRWVGRGWGRWWWVGRGWMRGCGRGGRASGWWWRAVRALRGSRTRWARWPVESGRWWRCRGWRRRSSRSWRRRSGGRGGCWRRFPRGRRGWCDEVQFGGVGGEAGLAVPRAWVRAPAGDVARARIGFPCAVKSDDPVGRLTATRIVLIVISCGGWWRACRRPSRCWCRSAWRAR